MAWRCREDSTGDEGQVVEAKAVDREEWAPVIKEAKAVRGP